MDTNNPPSGRRRLKVIHLEDNMLDRELVAHMLTALGIPCEFIYAHDGETFRAALVHEEADVIISDFSLPGYDGARALELATQIRRSIPFIFFSGTLGEEAAVESLKNGATDYVLKQRPGRLVAAVRRALAEVEERAIRQHAEEELGRRDALLRKIMETVDDLISVVDLNGRFLLLSPSHRRLFGDRIPKAGEEYLSMIHSDDHGLVHDAFHGAIRQGASQRVEFRIILPDGRIRFVEAQCSAMHDELGCAELVLWVSRDVTERKVVEERLLEQSTLLDQARDAISAQDLDARILFWNKSAERVYGWSALEALGRNADELLGQEKAALPAIRMVIQRGEWQGKLKQTTRAGLQLVVDSHWTLVRDDRGRAKSILVINTDVTEQVKAQEKIREQAALLDKASDAIFVCNMDGQILYWNAGATQLYGWSSSQALGRKAHVMLFKEPSAEAPPILSALLEKGEWVGELGHVTQGDRAVIVQSRQTLVPDAAGQAASILHINSDVTEKKLLESQFLRTQRMQSLGALAGGVAHDLNNVLAPIITAVDLIESDLNQESNGRLLEIIGSSARRGSDLIKQILSFARGAGAEKVDLDIPKLIGEMALLIQDTFPKAITLTTHIEADLPAIRGDTSQFHQVLLNLCVNARDAMPDGGALAIEARAVSLETRRIFLHPEPVSGRFIEITVADSGMGMPPEVQSKIFEPFFTTKDPDRGTGLGLSTLVNIVKGHGGFVDLASQPGVGTTFFIYLPIVEESAPAPVPAAERKPTQGWGEQILVVDDEIAIVETTSAMLAASNYRVLSANNGLDAVALFAKNHAEIELVISDMVMPGLGGEAMLRALRSIKPSVKVIAVSGYPLNDRTLFDAFLKKPYAMSTLLATIRETLGADRAG
jgi:hypothetical protein